MEILVEIIHVIVALFMILVVLVQGGNQGGMSAAFGGGNSSGVFGATGATTFLGKLTYGAAFIFMVTSILLTVMQGKGGNIDLQKKLQGAVPAATAPATPEAKKDAAAPKADAPAAANTLTPKAEEPKASPDAAAPGPNALTPAPVEAPKSAPAP